LGALADPEPGVALPTLPVDVMKATPDDCFTGRSLEPNQLYAFTQDKTRDYVSISDFHGFGCESVAVFSPSHPLVQLVPGLSNRSRGTCSVADLFGPDKQAGRTDRHWNINQDWIQGGHNQQD
jgi:hypothetical protein